MSSNLKLKIENKHVKTLFKISVISLSGIILLLCAAWMLNTSAFSNYVSETQFSTFTIAIYTLVFLGTLLVLIGSFFNLWDLIRESRNNKKQKDPKDDVNINGILLMISGLFLIIDTAWSIQSAIFLENNSKLELLQFVVNSETPLGILLIIIGTMITIVKIFNDIKRS